MAQMPPAISELLLLPVVRHRLRMLLSVPAPVIGIPSAPLGDAVGTDLAVFGIGGDLLPVIVTATLTLAKGFTTNRLQGLELGRLKGLLTVAAAAFPHNRRCPTAVMLPSQYRKSATPISAGNRVVDPGESNAAKAPPSTAGFRNYCRVHTASPPM